MKGFAPEFEDLTDEILKLQGDDLGAHDGRGIFGAPTGHGCL